MKGLKKILMGLMALAFVCAPATAETRTHIIALEGENSEIVETRFESRLGYALWYDAEQFTYYAEGMTEGGDMFVPSSDDAVTPVYLSSTLREGQTVDEVIASQQARFGEGTYYDGGEQTLDSGVTCRVLGAQRAGVSYTLYLFTMEKGVLILETGYAAEAAEGFGARLAETVSTFETLTETTMEIYGPDADFNKLVATEMSVYDTPQSMLYAIKDMGGLPGDVEVLSYASVDEKTATLDLSANFGEMMASAGTAGEYIYMGSIVNTFLAHYNLDSITVLCEGVVVQTGHNTYNLPQQTYA